MDIEYNPPFNSLLQGMVEAGMFKPIMITWLPPQGHNVSLYCYDNICQRVTYFIKSF